MTTYPKAEYGITCHVLRPINLCVSDSFHQAALSLARGDEVLLTPAVIEANRGTDGVCAVLDNLDAPGAAIRRGPWPAGLSRLTHGSFEHLEAREAARVQAH